ncbi:MAG: hypothetical protein R3314_02705 [Longimicrobiales bacterium]|nr:hypothetical protein [Longimicrobiales bacterium]
MRTQRNRLARRMRVVLRRGVARRLPAWLPNDLAWWLRVGGISLSVAALSVAGCAPTSEHALGPRSTMFIGVDVSGSFEDDGRYDDAMAFAAYYIHGHLTGKAELEQPRALFVGAIGGERPGETQAFHPIHDFEGKSPAEIEADLRQWFPPNDRYTDFNAFFQRAATLVQRQNLALAPITLVLLTDGVPDLGRHDGDLEGAERYAQIDLDPLEYLARNVTLRVLYPDPSVAVHWERDVPRDRVRIWTVDHVVMRGWREQLEGPAAVASTQRPADRGEDVRPSPDTAPDPITPSTEIADRAVPDADPASAGGGETVELRGGAMGDPRLPGETMEEVRGLSVMVRTDQPDLWRWIKDNVDFRVRRSVL